MFLLILAFFFQVLYQDSVENGWKGIKSLQTSKIEAEKILGKPTLIAQPEKIGHAFYKYESEENKVFINYSTEPCKKNYGGRGDYDVPKDTVLEYSVFPKTLIKLSDFKYNREKYLQRREEGEFTDFFYENDDDGITFSTKIKGETEYLYHIVFSPKIKNINYRECTSKINFEIENGWEGIKTLQTNKTEVEKILSKPTDSSDYASEYKTEEANIRVKYTSEPCRKVEFNRGDYNVPKDTVLIYEVYLNKALKLADFKFNRDKFKQEAGGGYFSNEDDGIYFLTKKRDDSEYVSMITFEPGIKNINYRQCGRKEDSIENGWKGIKSLRTDRFSAEKILGKPTSAGQPDMPDIFYYIYKTDEATVQINYKETLCKEASNLQEERNSENYDVPKDTILKYLVFPKTPIKLIDFKFNREKYKRFENRGEYTDYFYENDADGITFSTKITNSIEYIYNIRFEPRTKNIGNRNCKTIEELNYPATN